MLLIKNGKFLRPIFAPNKLGRPRKNNIRDVINIDSKNRKIYKIIWEITLQSCMASSIYDLLTIHISAPFDLKYIKNVKKIVFDGWERVSGYKDEEKEYNYLILCN